jgi:signal peptidase I
MVMLFCSSECLEFEEKIDAFVPRLLDVAYLIIPYMICRCPSDHRELFVKRLIALPGEWMQLPGTPDIIKIPEGHCWVEGDNAACSWDSRSFGPVSYFCSFSCLIPVQHATLISHKFG